MNGYIQLTSKSYLQLVSIDIPQHFVTYGSRNATYKLKNVLVTMSNGDNQRYTYEYLMAQKSNQHRLNFP